MQLSWQKILEGWCVLVALGNSLGIDTGCFNAGHPNGSAGGATDDPDSSCSVCILYPVGHSAGKVCHNEGGIIGCVIVL